ncbi:MAG: TauD/TfdA family dioxygenase [Minwuia sp.]|nr:TauD/TfdA family dioxygenase [Minwuia sp.]
MTSISLKEISLEQTNQGTGILVHGIQLQDTLNDDVILDLKMRIAREGILIFRGQTNLSEEEQIRFTRQFGPTNGHPLPGIGGDNPNDDANKQIFYLTNAIERGDKNAAGKQNAPAKKTTLSPNEGELQWHSDLQYMPEPQVYSILYGMEIPENGGDTEWCNMEKAYAALDEATKQRIKDLTAVNWLTRRLEPVSHPVVRIHPLTGQKSLYVSPGLTRYIEDMDKAESAELLSMLTSHATKPEFSYRHSWSEGDVIMWDNRLTMHRRHGFDLEQRRIVRRTQTIGEPVIAA